MQAKFTLLILPYTRNELPGWGRVMDLVGVWADSTKLSWKEYPIVLMRGKKHGYLMNLDLSDWAQRMTYFLGRYYELTVLRTLDIILRPGDMFVDIGANIGMISLHARYLVGESGKVECFEPNPECVSAISEHLRINGLENVTVHPCALAETAGRMTLNLPTEHSGHATLAGVGRTDIRKIPVNVLVGDEVIAGDPRLIKIDVEGFELHVLRGLSRTLKNYKPYLITELVESHLHRAESSVKEVSDFLFDLGYCAYGLYSTRRPFRRELALQPLMRGGNFSSFTDVLWVHEEKVDDLSKFVRDKYSS